MTASSHATMMIITQKVECLDRTKFIAINQRPSSYVTIPSQWLPDVGFFVDLLGFALGGWRMSPVPTTVFGLPPSSESHFQQRVQCSDITRNLEHNTSINLTISVSRHENANSARTRTWSPRTFTKSWIFANDKSETSSIEWNSRQTIQPQGF